MNIKEILEINKRQKDFYNSSENKKRNIVTRAVCKVRCGTLNNFRNKHGITERVNNLHKIWLGDLSDKKILELGCLSGCDLSLYMAQNAKKYIGIDLAEKSIEVLQKKIEKKGCKNAFAIAIDFLSPEFKESNFDIIYARSVLHHFENFNLLVDVLKEKLVSGGVIISYDPLKTSIPINLFRKAFRPFQSDKDWEWPFTKKTLKKINHNFQIEEIRGILGRSKYGLFIDILPFNNSYKKRKIKKLVERDWHIKELKEVYSCMITTMLLRKP